MTKLFFILIIISLGYTTGCGQKKNELPEIRNWQGGSVKKAGIYYYKDKNICLKVYIEKKLVKYQMLDSTGKELLRNGKVAASVLHKWGFYLDDKKNLWCLSSDLGHSEWKFDPAQNKYSLVKLYYTIKRENVPAPLYKDFKEFFDGNTPEMLIDN